MDARTVPRLNPFVSVLNKVLYFVPSFGSSSLVFSFFSGFVALGHQNGIAVYKSEPPVSTISLVPSVLLMSVHVVACIERCAWS
jgi:hypothetical protein